MLNRYKEVVMLNEELLTGCFIRRATQEQAVTSLKSLHTILQQAARLRGISHLSICINFYILNKFRKGFD